MQCLIEFPCRIFNVSIANRELCRSTQTDSTCTTPSDVQGVCYSVSDCHNVHVSGVFSNQRAAATSCCALIRSYYCLQAEWHCACNHLIINDVSRSNPLSVHVCTPGEAMLLCAKHRKTLHNNYAIFLYTLLHHAGHVSCEAHEFT
jgi:hypothetical protein